jgi:hypothetical protein
MCFSQNTHNGEFFRLSTHILRCRIIQRAGHRPAWHDWLPPKPFSSERNSQEPVRSRYKYPDASNKYILETLYFRENVNNRDEVLGCKQP